MKGGIENVGLLESVQLNLTVTHLIVHTLKIIIQLQLLSFKLAVLLLIPEAERNKQTEMTNAFTWKLKNKKKRI